MAQPMEYKYVILPTNGEETRSADVDSYASEELNRLCTTGKWEVVNVTRPSSIGPIGFLPCR